MPPTNADADPAANGPAERPRKRDLLVSPAKRATRSAARGALGVVKASWPAIERIALLERDRGLSVDWSDEWGERHENALLALPIDDEQRSRAVLLAQPVDVPKRHAIVHCDGELGAVVSLRRRPDFWEPVSAQCLPGTPMACRPELLGRVLRGLGVEIRIGSTYQDPADLGPTYSYSYVRYGADLTGDYEKFWPSGHRRARKKTKGFVVRSDHPGDLEWTLDAWVEMWRDHPNGETAAALDRKRLWSTMQHTGEIHTVMLADGDTPVAGYVLFCDDGVAKFECTGRRMDYERFRVGTRALDACFEWAASAGYHTFDVGGGGAYKATWAPSYATSYAAVFQPRTIRAARGIERRLEGISNSPESASSDD